MTSNLFNTACICALSLSFYASYNNAHAQSMNVTVPIGQAGALTAPSVLYVEQDLKKIPGGVDVIPAKDFEKSYALSMKDMLKYSPGIMAQPRWAEESRLSIRGSGLSRGFHLRGIMLLQDGVPFNLADGSADFQEINPLGLQHVEVYRGGQGLRYGASSLGGAINMVTPTAHTVPYTGMLRTEIGSFQTLRLFAQGAQKFDGYDVLANATKSVSDGFRAQSEQNNNRFSGNVGIDLGDNAQTRFYLSYNNIEQEIPGTISKFNALNNSKSVPAVNITGDYARDIKSLRLSNKTVLRLDNGGQFEFGGYMNDKDLYHPIFQVIDQKSLDLGAFARFEGVGDIASFKNDYTIGINIANGDNDAKRFVNVLGNRGALTADGNQKSQNYEIYGQNQFYLNPQWSLIGGIQGTLSKRDYADFRTPSNNDDAIFKSLNPKAGILWNYAPKSEAYVSITKSSETPTFSELVQGAVPGFVPVDMQSAWTAEIGTRGEAGALSWDATAYHAWVRDELLNFTTSVDVPASTFNTNKTIHRGLEIAGGYQATPNILLRGIYNFNDFYFDGDRQYGDNDLAGANPHEVKIFARYEKNNVFIEPNIEWIPKAAYVDYANTLKADSYTLIGVNAGVDVTPNINIFFDAKNLTNEKTITSFSTITDARTAGTNVFYPADGRSFYMGLSVKF